jgi:hypothetical protein
MRFAGYARSSQPGGVLAAYRIGLPEAGTDPGFPALERRAVCPGNRGHTVPEIRDPEFEATVFFRRKLNAFSFHFGLHRL